MAAPFAASMPCAAPNSGRLSRGSGWRRLRGGALGVAALLALAASGCAFGRAPSGPSDWPSAPSETPGPRTVYVSKFFEFTHGTSTTQSGTIAMIRETASIKDISGELATVVSQSGVRSVGKVGFDGQGMNKGDLWVRGIVQNLPVAGGGDETAALVVFCATLTTIGGLLPLPFPVEHGNRYKLRIEIVNSDGEIVFSKDDNVEVRYNTIYFYGIGSQYGNPDDRAEMLNRVGAAIGKYARQ